MGRSPCCSKEGLNRGAWTVLEDKILVAYIKAHGEGKWRNLPKRAGLKRCGKSCRLRWLNYLRPDIKRGNISHDEEELIIRLHNLLGNRWSLIAGRLPGRTDNEVKNYWNTTLSKKVQAQNPTSSPYKQRPTTKPKEKKPMPQQLITDQPAPPSKRIQPQVIRTKASRCTKAVVPPPHQLVPSLSTIRRTMDSTTKNSFDLPTHQNNLVTLQDLDNLIMDFGIGELCVSYSPNADFLCLASDEFQVSDTATGDDDNNHNLSTASDHSLLFDEPMLEDWTENDRLEPHATLDLGTLASFLDAEEWP